MKNIYSLAFLVIMLGSYCHAQTGETEYGFSFGVRSGIIYGQASELVFPVPGDTKGELLSELLWDIKPVFYLGIYADIKRKNQFEIPGLFSSISFKAGIPADTGYIEDRDWMSFENAALTHFSSHTNKTNLFFNAEISFGAAVPVRNNFYFKTFINGSWIHYAFTGRDGYGKYAREKSVYPRTYYAIDDDPKIYDFTGMELINYKQDWLIFSPGFSAGARMFNVLTIDLSLKISLFNYCIAQDEHISLKDKYVDIIYGNLFLEPAADIIFSINRFDIMFNITWKQLSGSSGFSYKNNNDAGFFLSQNKSGAAINFIDACLLVKIRL